MHGSLFRPTFCTCRTLCVSQTNCDEWFLMYTFYLSDVLRRSLLQSMREETCLSYICLSYIRFHGNIIDCPLHNQIVYIIEYRHSSNQCTKRLNLASLDMVTGRVASSAEVQSFVLFFVRRSINLVLRELIVVSNPYIQYISKTFYCIIILLFAQGNDATEYSPARSPYLHLTSC